MKLNFTKIIIAAIVLAGTQSVARAQLIGDTYASAKQSKTATWVVTHSDSPGLATMDADGKPSGVCFDLMSAFADYVKTKAGITVTMKYQTENATDFTMYLKDVKSAKGGVFGLSNTTITTERKKEYRFSPPFIKNVSMLVCNTKVPDLKDIKDISTSGLSAVTIKGSTNEARILKIKSKYFPKMQIEYVSSFSKSLERVIADPKTFTCIDFTYYLKAVQSKKPVKRQVVGDEEGEEFGIIMPVSNDWSGLLTEFMNEGFMKSAKFNKIITDNLGQSVSAFTKKVK
jgi:Bacterial extracellular solute-binding proteins, family 3